MDFQCFSKKNSFNRRIKSTQNLPRSHYLAIKIQNVKETDEQFETHDKQEEERILLIECVVTD